MRFYKIYFLLILFFFSSILIFSQHKPSKERTNTKFRAKSQMEGNKIRTTIFNHGQTGRYGGGVPITEQTPYEWPKNTGQVYLALTGLVVGGEVLDSKGNNIKIVDFMNYRTSPEGKSWNFEPIPGYYSESKQEIANSVDPTTWPSTWPDKSEDSKDPGWKGKWNGYFGKNVFNADQELFYKAGDDNYYRYTDYSPDTTDVTRKGLGIIFDSRTLAWSQILVEDVVYLLHNIKNDGTKNINKVAVSLWYADFVGGDGDSQDDWSEFDLIQDIAWSRDKDNTAPKFGSDPVGIIAVSFLETPGNGIDRIDNDGDGELNAPKVSLEMLKDETPDDLVDNNGNGLIDENDTHIPLFNGTQKGVTYADYIDDNGDAETGSPVVTLTMLNQASIDKWKRWPANPEVDPIQNGQVHLLMVGSEDVGKAFKDNIDNNGNGENSSPVITQAIIDAAKNDPLFRYKVPNSKIILFDVKQDDLGKKYADGIDNDGNGAVDEIIDEGIDEMVDEKRNDGIDNDGDWNVLNDDVGLDGVPNTGDKGEGDGKPTSGAGTNFPGEPNIDVTDVSETDQIGITNAQYIPAGDLNVNTTADALFWFKYMIPGKFYDPTLGKYGEYDLFVASSFFPLNAGQTEPISLAVILANGPANDPGGEFRKREILKKRVRAQETYNNDYQFANAPLIPTVTGVPGNNRVTLYWDDVAESSFDKYINNIGGNGKDFEGYRIYRASDPAFLDAENITNGFGTKLFKTPLAIFDLKDGMKGFDSIGIDGVKFYLGTDSGLKHSWVDSTVQNGYTYYYAVTSFDFGYNAGKIIPAECPIRVSVQSDGSVKLGRNVVIVKPEAPAAGYIPPTLGKIDLVKGTTTGQIMYDIVDNNKLFENHVYKITFEDTLVVTPGKPDTLKTKNFTLSDSTANVVLIDKSSNISEDYEQPLVDGFRLKFKNETRVELNSSNSKWNNKSIPNFVFEKLEIGFTKGQENISDYNIIFGNVGIDTAQKINIEGIDFPSQPVNFKVFDKGKNKFIKFGFMELDSSDGKGKLSANSQGYKDRIVFLEPNTKDSLIFTWWFFLSIYPDTALKQRNPMAGDTAVAFLKKPFLKSDIFRFVTQKEKIDKNLAKEQLEKIKVVPNPYVATAKWEIKNPYSSGRGPRSLHFTHLPNECKIRIFTVNGELVKTIDHFSQFNDGTAEWDMLSDDKLSISYGIYVYHIDAPGVGEKIGKFAVIK